MPVIINFKTDKKIKAQAQKIANEMGLNLSDILNVFLRGFIRKKEIHIDLKDESRPSDNLLKAISDKDDKKKFKNIDDLKIYLKKL